MENFDKFASDYKTILDDSLKLSGESSDYFFQYKANYIKNFLGTDFKGKVLDFGCGVGMLSAILLDHFPNSHIDGFDISALSITHVPQKLKRQGTFTDRFEDICTTYDLIIVANVLHHTPPEERKTLLFKLKKLLNPQGRIFIFEHNPFNPVTCKIVRESPLDKGVILLPSSEVIGYLKEAGYLNLYREYIVFFPKPLSSLRFMEKYISWIPMGAQYVIQGENP